MCSSAAFFSARIMQILMNMLTNLPALPSCLLAVRNYSEPVLGMLTELVHKILVWHLTLPAFFFLSFPVMGL